MAETATPLIELATVTKSGLMQVPIRVRRAMGISDGGRIVMLFDAASRRGVFMLVCDAARALPCDARLVGRN